MNIDINKNKDKYLYKVSPPRDSLIFNPSVFYRTNDYSSSSDKPKDGHLEDKLLYAGEFFDVAIHLLPPDVFRIQVPNQKGNFHDLEHLSYKPDQANESVIFIEESDFEKVINFQPTVYIFDKSSLLETKIGFTAQD